jgi:DHA1 family bicyclomycin/chloramphenicol resistance-like MFS transporter
VIGSRPIRRLWILFVLGAFTGLGPLSIDMYLPALPHLARGFGASASATQLTLTSCLVGLAAGQLAFGALSDRFGRRAPMLGGTAAYVVAALACAFSPSVAVLVIARFALGLAGAAGIVVARAIVRDLFGGDEMARIFARLMLVNGLAPIVAPVIGGQVLRFTSWRGIFVVLAVAGALLLAAAATLPETLAREQRRDAGLAPVVDAMRTLGRDRSFLGYTVAQGFAFGAMFVYIAGSPFVFQDIHHVSSQAYSFVFAANALGIALFGQTGAALLGRRSARSLLLTGHTLQLVGAVALAVVVGAGVGIGGVAAALFVTVASIGLVLPNASALALADHPTIAGSAAGVIGVFQYLLGAIAAPIAGAGGSQTAWPMAGAILALAAAAFVVVRRT